MLSQINEWAEHTAMVVDLILMLRILTLKLRKTYLFITLFALLSLFYDGIELFLGSQSSEFQRVWFLSRFIYAIAFPLAVWEVFEEAKAGVDKIRKLAMTRMLTSLLFISVWGLLIAAFTGGDDGDQSQYLMRLAMIVWAGSLASALAFLWVMRRGVKTIQLKDTQVEMPRNTLIWYWYFQLLLAIEAVSCIQFLLWPVLHSYLPDVGKSILEGIEIVLQACEIAVTAWCVYKLRAVPAGPTNVAIDVKS